MRKIIVLSMVLCLAGCSDNHLKPGTEMMLDEAGAASLTVHNMSTGHKPSEVSKGTKVRVIKDSDEISGQFIDRYRKVEVYVLEGTNKDENFTVEFAYLIKCDPNGN